MSDKARDQSGSTDPASSNVPTGRTASSPFDEPTEKLPTARSTYPQTDDDLGLDPTEHMPVYRPQDHPALAADYQQVSTAPVPAIPDAPSQGPPPAAPAAPYMSKRNASFDDEPVSRGTIDVGLLILRVAVGAIFVFHGLQKLTGWWNGPGLDGMEQGLAQGGWEQPRLSAILVTVGELAGGSMLILGLATPLAAGAVLAVIIDAWLVRQSMEPGLQFTAPDGPEYESLLIAASAALILTGPGRISADGRRGWATRPYVGSVLALLAAIVASACTWIFLRGGNPFV